MIDFLTADEIAKRLKVKPETVKVWAREGRIPTLRLSHKVLRFDLVAVVEALKKNQELAHA